MLLQLGAWLGTLVLLAATVCFHLVGCKKEKEAETSLTTKKRDSLNMGCSDLDEVTPVKREVKRAQEIKDGARGRKAEYKTLAQMQTSDNFDKSLHTPSASASPKPP